MNKKLDVVDSLPPRGKVDWLEVAQAARDNPGKWVIVPVEMYSGVLQNFKKGGIVGLSPTEFEMTTQRVEGGPKRTFFVRLLDAEA